ncbi:MAG: hypothetical protein AseanaTS_17740 [Candidatus Pelagadaptatus aseana]
MIRYLVEENALGEDYSRDSVAMFQAHFLVMNALYSLKRDRYPTLIISPLEIFIDQPQAQFDNNGAVADLMHTDLSDYYLDWTNFKGATQDSVEGLLNRFWEKYLAMDDSAWALQMLDLQAPVTIEDIKRRYRKLAMALHPDRGGDHQQLVEINRARDILIKIYG